jgi:hypothetical protein
MAHLDFRARDAGTAVNGVSRFTHCCASLQRQGEIFVHHLLLGVAMTLFTLIFSDEETGKVRSTVTDIRGVRHINPKEVAITELSGQRRSIAFHQNEKLEVTRREVEYR